ncbi:MAG: synthase protein [Actinomycetota bacterium]|nr:synthase protein [Actinomycetota bacterium]
MDLKARQELNQGFGNALGLAVEMVGTPMLFGLLGWLLDRWLGTAPLFVVVLFLFGVVGMAVKTYYAYVEKMRQHEAQAPWSPK